MPPRGSVSVRIACLVLRLTLGVIMIPHGMQKLFGAFGGSGLEGTANFFAKIGLTPGNFWARVAALVEFGGGLFLLVGFLTRLAALLVAVEMATAILKVHVPKFFVSQGGMEFPMAVAVVAIAVALVLPGAGPLSVDHAIGLERGSG